MKPAALYRLAKAATVIDKPSLTIAATDGHVYAAWPYGCVLLPGDVIDWLGVPDPGHYTITAKGELGDAEIRNFSVQLISDQMLPLLDRDGRQPATIPGWIHEDGILLRRYLSVGDEQLAAAVHDDHWRAWKPCTTGHLYAAPFGRGHLIAWAPDATARATALLLGTPSAFLPTPPTWTPEGP